MSPTLAGIEEEVRLIQLDAAEPPLPGQPRGLSMREWIRRRMREAAEKALKKEPTP